MVVGGASQLSTESFGFGTWQHVELRTPGAAYETLSGLELAHCTTLLTVLCAPEGNLPARAVRISYVGELGWELHVRQTLTYYNYHRLHQTVDQTGHRF